MTDAPVVALPIAADAERRFYVGDLSGIPVDLDMRLVAILELRGPDEACAVAHALLSTGEPACAE